MDRLYFTAQVNAAPDHLSYVQDTASSEPGTSGRAFSRDVGEAATSLYTVSRDETTENHLQQPAVPFHNPFDDPRFEKRSIVIIDGLTRQDQVLDITVRRKLQRSEPTYIYNVGLPQRASQCLLCVDNAIGILPLNPGTIYPGQSKLPFSNLNFYEKEWSQGGVQ
ncbi:hypothetical protein J7438_10490 [Thalassotalea sp. G20_0]|uniref:hypothetical protein n=1 Tax=Thalassotalea sp. G20_0 TaxID=2821093 RepID=UPI001ADD22E8|nr:hypothetical protein [Thalassotalea sp. G20_0]MBO9494513.1 hypothetical protein [Thalassotalea sp. G20_0]